MECPGDEAASGSGTFLASKHVTQAICCMSDAMNLLAEIKISEDSFHCTYCSRIEIEESYARENLVKAVHFYRRYWPKHASLLQCFKLPRASSFDDSDMVRCQAFSGLM